jgi:ParB family transcriptional regulator, chromosome partitioning protein
MSKKLGLGQGVGLLFGEEKEIEKYFECDIEAILPNKYQPREHFDETELQNLAQSIRENGIIQPLIVTACKDSEHYELVAGERRLRASKIVGLKNVPVVLYEVNSNTTRLELALIENIQRTDLNPLEEAEAYRKLIENFGYTQEETANKVGKQRSTITNLLRLLKLPESVQRDISEGILSEGHARSLIRLLDEPLKLLEARDSILKNSLSVRQTEKMVKRLVSPGRSKVIKQQNEEISQSYCSSLAIDLTNYLNSKVTIHHASGRGKIEIDFYSPDDLDRVTNLLMCNRQ